jgi:hypothetical protein
LRLLYFMEAKSMAEARSVTADKPVAVIRKVGKEE